MKLVILGPNLADQRKGQFHVHADGCRDIARTLELSGRPAEPWHVEAETRREVIEEINGDLIAEQCEEHGANESGAWEAYESDVHFLPCCKGLPRE